jgi:hypothetical protein
VVELGFGVVGGRGGGSTAVSHRGGRGRRFDRRWAAAQQGRRLGHGCQAGPEGAACWRRGGGSHALPNVGVEAVEVEDGGRLHEDEDRSGRTLA